MDSFLFINYFEKFNLRWLIVFFKRSFFGIFFGSLVEGILVVLEMLIVIKRFGGGL